MREQGAPERADCVACGKFHDTSNVLAYASEEYHSRNNNVRRFDPSSAHTSQGHKEDTGGEREEAQWCWVCKATVIYRHPWLAAVIRALGLQT